MNFEFNPTITTLIEGNQQEVDACFSMIKTMGKTRKLEALEQILNLFEFSPDDNKTKSAHKELDTYFNRCCQLLNDNADVSVSATTFHRWLKKGLPFLTTPQITTLLQSKTMKDYAKSSSMIKSSFWGCLWAIETGKDKQIQRCLTSYFEAEKYITPPKPKDRVMEEDLLLRFALQTNEDLFLNYKDLWVKSQNVLPICFKFNPSLVDEDLFKLVSEDKWEDGLLAIVRGGDQRLFDLIIDNMKHHEKQTMINVVNSILKYKRWGWLDKAFDHVSVDHFSFSILNAIIIGDDEIIDVFVPYINDPNCFDMIIDTQALGRHNSFGERMDVFKSKVMKSLLAEETTQSYKNKQQTAMRKM